jgi:hypothetical protein
LLPTDRDRGFEPRLSLSNKTTIEFEKFYLLLNQDHHYPRSIDECLLFDRPVRKLTRFLTIGVSSNGRTSDSGSEYRGSNPCTPAEKQVSFTIEFIYFGSHFCKHSIGVLPAGTPLEESLHPSQTLFEILKISTIKRF